MSQQSKMLMTLFYGLGVIANGLLSLFSKEGGTIGLRFGLVMGVIALAACFLLWTGHRLLGPAVAWSVVAFVGGWFVYSTFIKKGFGHGELRAYFIIAISLLEALVLCLPTKQKSKAPGENWSADS